jgi:hypothetical protein
VRRLLGTEHRIYLSQSLLLYFQRNRGRLVEGGKSNMVEAVGEISKILRSKFEELLEDTELSEGQSRQMEKDVFKRLNVEKQLHAVERPLLEAQKQDAGYTAAVEVTADKLAEVPEASISSIKVKAQVRNYMWSKVEHEGKTWRSLNPE